MTTFRITYMTVPGVARVYCRIDTVTPNTRVELKLVGTMTLTRREFDDFRREFRSISTVEFVPEQWEEIRQNLPLEEAK